jgi:hypothetical protein
MIDDTQFHVDNEAYYNQVRDLGRDGVVWESSGFCPPYDYTRQYFGMFHGLENWVYVQYDYPDAFACLVAALDRKAERLVALLANVPARFVGVGSLDGNYGPAQFESWVLPFYLKYVPMLQARGKICSIHAHASNLRSFRDQLKATGVRMIEAFTPPPVGDLSLAEARAAWGRETVIWVHFPETIFLYGPDQTKAYALDLLRSDPCPESLVISITEMGIACVSDDEGERAFKAGIRALMDAIDEFARG